MLDKLMSCCYKSFIRSNLNSRVPCVLPWFCLLIRVSIYQNVHLSEWISKMVVANFLKHNEGQGQRSKVKDSTILGTCIMVLIASR